MYVYCKELYTHSQVPPQDSGVLFGQADLLVLQGTQVADVAFGCVAVVLVHLILVLRAFPLLEVTQGFDQWVPCEHRQLQVFHDVLFTQ